MKQILFSSILISILVSSIWYLMYCIFGFSRFFKLDLESCKKQNISPFIAITELSLVCSQYDIFTMFHIHVPLKLKSKAIFLIFEKAHW